MYKRYQGNSGLMRRVGEPEAPRGAFPPPPPPPGHAAPPPPPPRGAVPPPPSPLAGLLGRLPGRLAALETEDLLLLLILYLLYRESGETEWLVALAALLFLE